MSSVLIAGAGPTGLVLALWLTRAGIPVRIIDKASGLGTTSRATVIHARTLEYYRQLGIDGAATRQGINFESGNIWVNGKVAVRLPFGDASGDLSPFSYVLIFPQDLHEQMLTAQLDALGVHVARDTELVSFEQRADGIRAQIRRPDGAIEPARAAYLAGCDGAHSAVRHTLGIGFPGGAYENIFYVADLKIKGPVANGELNIALDDADFLLVFPMKGEGRVRLIGSVRQRAVGKEPGQITWADVQQHIMRRLRIEVLELRWFSAYHVHHRVAAGFRQGRAFLLGDAGHIHSPVGGQGMNTGIGDAVNLAWKLAAVLKDGAPPALLDTYEPERIAFARRLVATTDRVFSFVDKQSRLAAFIRTRIVPAVLRVLFRIPALRRAAFRQLSQTMIHYRERALSTGGRGRVQAGDRLPWVPHNDTQRAGAPDNFTPLACMCWQVHVYGNATEALSRLCRERCVRLCVFPYGQATARKGLRRDAAYVIRPDGYIGLALPGGGAAAVAAYLQQWYIGTPLVS